MTPEKIAIINLIAKVGLDAAIRIIESLSRSVTVDDAIAALKAASTKTAQDYLDEARAARTGPTTPT